VLLALRYYGREMARLRRFTVPGMLLPALGNTCISYVAPLIVAELALQGRLLTQEWPLTFTARRQRSLSGSIALVEQMTSDLVS
jgi:hypothetical protein